MIEHPARHVGIYDLTRFIEAQEPVFDIALSELRAGQKKTHWMWFIFPQLRALGRSETAKHFGLESCREAAAYLNHDTLGPRLRVCTRAALEADAPSLTAYLGTPDDLKFRSSMTLFSVVGGVPDTDFHRALDKWCDGKPDTATLDLLFG